MTTTAECPECHTQVPLTAAQADYDDVIVTCPNPKCRQQFTHERKE